MPGEPPWGLYADGIRLIALRALNDPTLADEIAQEAVTRAISNLAGGRETPVADLGGFVYGIARHLIADVHRARARTVSLDETPEPAAPTRSPLEIVIAEEDRRRLHAAIDELPSADRDLLRSFFMEGLDAEEVGRRLGETPVNIRKRKSRALERLRRIFAGHDEHSDATDRR